MNQEDSIAKLHSIIMNAIEKDGSFTCDTDGSTIWIDVSNNETLAISINPCITQNN